MLCRYIVLSLDAVMYEVINRGSNTTGRVNKPVAIIIGEVYVLTPLTQYMKYPLSFLNWVRKKKKTLLRDN